MLVNYTQNKSEQRIAFFPPEQTQERSNFILASERIIEKSVLVLCIYTYPAL